MDGPDSEDEFEKHRLMWITKDVSDKVVDGCLRRCASLGGKRSKNGKGRLLPGWNSTSAFNDTKLAGGGYENLSKDLVVRQLYCPNERRKYGKAECGRMISEDHEGPCRHCETAVYKLMPDGTKSFLSVDYFFRVGKYYQLLVQHTDLPQRIVDYYPEAAAQLSVPLDDKNHRVRSIMGGYVARYDYQQNSHRFTLDIIPKVGENAMHDLGRAFNNELTPAIVVGEGEFHYHVRHLDDSATTHRVNKEDIFKVHGTLPLAVVTAEDGSEVYGDMQYSNMGKVEMFVNISDKHRRREEFLVPLAISAGGTKHYNVSQRGIWQAKQAEDLAKNGAHVGPFTVWVGSRKVTVHSATLYRNEICKVMDNPEVANSAGVIDQRNPCSLRPFLADFEAFSTQRKCVYTYLLNQEAKPRKRHSSDMGFESAHQLLGTQEWVAHSKATGFKFQPVQWVGDHEAGLEGNPDQCNWLRVEHEKLHATGIIVKNMREFLLSLVPPKRRSLLASQPHAIRQPPGTQPIHPLIKINKKDGAVQMNTAGEKLHQKLGWVRQRMLFDLLPMFEGDEQVKQVTRGYMLVRCLSWRLKLDLHFSCLW